MNVFEGTFLDYLRTIHANDGTDSCDVSSSKPKGHLIIGNFKRAYFCGFCQGPRELSVYLNAGVREVSFDCTHKL